MAGLVISGGRIVDPASGMDAVADLALLQLDGGRRSALPTWAMADKSSGMLSVGIIPLPNFTLTAFAGFIDMLRLAADEGDRSRPLACRWTVLGSELRRPVRASCGIELIPGSVFGSGEAFDYVVVVGGLLPSPEDKMLDPRTLAFLRASHATGAGIIGICTGSLALAEAGLLPKGARCCVSWYHYPDLIERFPDLVPVADRLWVQEGRIATCAGGLAVADLAAALVDRHLGGSVAQKSLHILLSDGQRLAGAAQPQPPNTLAVRDARVRRAMLMMEQNLSAPPAVEQLAAAGAVSARQLERLFRRELGVSIQTFGRDLRLYYAVWFMMHAPGRFSDIAAQSGFSDAAHFSRTFRAAFDQPPAAAQRMGRAGLQAMVERWWPHRHHATPAALGTNPAGPAAGDRRPYV